MPVMAPVMALGTFIRTLTTQTLFKLFPVMPGHQKDHWTQPQEIFRERGLAGHFTTIRLAHHTIPRHIFLGIRQGGVQMPKFRISDFRALPT